MSKPKNMTPDQERTWLDKQAARNKAYRDANKEKEAARNKAKNPIKVAAYKKKWREMNKEKEAARSKERWRKDPEKCKAHGAATRAKMTNGVISARLGLKVAECPDEIIELKREQLLMYRMTKQLNQSIKEQENAE